MTGARKKIHILLATLCLAMLDGIGPVRVARADRGEIGLSVSGGYSLVALEQLRHGGGAQAQLQVGVSDALALQLQGALSVFPAEGGHLLSGAVLAGVVYSLDLLRVVPSFEAALGLLCTGPLPGPLHEETGTRLAAGLHLGLTVDYLLHERLALGLAVRYQAALSDPGRQPLLLQLGPRLALRFN